MGVTDAMSTVIDNVRSKVSESGRAGILGGHHPECSPTAMPGGRTRQKRFQFFHMPLCFSLWYTHWLGCYHEDTRRRREFAGLVVEGTCEGHRPTRRREENASIGQEHPGEPGDMFILRDNTYVNTRIA
jgi:hypothetical protein